MANSKLNAAEIVKKTAEYFDLVEQSRKELPLKNGDIKVRYGKPATMIGLAYHLGISKETMYTLMNREYRTTLSEEDNKTIADCLTDARSKIEAMTLERAASGDYEPKIATLILNGFGYNYKDEDQKTIRIIVGGADSGEVNEWSK